MVKIYQKYMEKDGKKIGYVAVELHLNVGDKKYTYPIKFDEKTRKRFNYYARSLGFKIGVVDKDCPDSGAEHLNSVEKYEEIKTDVDLPF